MLHLKQKFRHCKKKPASFLFGYGVIPHAVMQWDGN